jgi:hypothetical protein
MQHSPRVRVCRSRSQAEPSRELAHAVFRLAPGHLPRYTLKRNSTTSPSDVVRFEAKYQDDMPLHEPSSILLDMQDLGEKNFDVFSRFYAVVLDHWAGAGRRVRWSPSHMSWLCSKDYPPPHNPRDCWLSAPGETFGRPNAPTEEDRAAAADLALNFIQPGRQICQRCWQADPGLHFIAPDVYGDPEIYCVQFPSYTVVDSKGGSGAKKHSGGPFGCRSVEHVIASGWGERGPYLGPLAAYVFGHPLPADEVIAREWCSRCVGTAYNVKANTGDDESRDAWAKKQVEMHVKHLARTLSGWYGDQ